MESQPSPQVQYFDWTPEDQIQAEAVLSSDTEALRPFIREKFERESHKMWNTFYLHNGDRFFRDRHYLTNEFPELLRPNICVLEIGCGVGNAVFPLFEVNPTIRVQAVDFAPAAIELVRANPLYSQVAITAEVCDIVQGPPDFPEPCDFVLLLFVLSAISPEHQREAIINATAGLRPGGFVLVRDYGKYDLAQLRLAKHRQNKLEEDFYLKQDGTRVCYFQKERIRDLFQGFEEVQNDFHYRLVENRKEGLKMKRVWLQAKYMKIGLSPA